MLDTRQYRGEHSPGAPLVGPRALGPYEAEVGRTILGNGQRAWLLDGLDAAEADGVPWKIIGNQVMMAPIRMVDLDTPENRAIDPTLPKHAGIYSNSNFDSWDGFGWERDLVLAHLHDAGVDNTVFVTGDYHSFWAAPLVPDFDAPGSPVVAHDFCAGAVSSAGGAFNENIITGGSGSITTSPGFDYQDLFRNGYGLVEATHGQLDVTFFAHNAAYRNTTPIPTVRFGLTPGDPVATKQLL
jgi:alkaline phosphatase D